MKEEKSAWDQMPKESIEQKRGPDADNHRTSNAARSLQQEQDSHAAYDYVHLVV